MGTLRLPTKLSQISMTQTHAQTMETNQKKKQKTTAGTAAAIDVAQDRPRFQTYCMKEALENDGPGNVLRPVFSKAEFRARLQGLRDVMQREGLDFCILTSVHNVKYMTNFLYCSFGRN